jgi:hypothetical protein
MIYQIKGQKSSQKKKHLNKNRHFHQIVNIPNEVRNDYLLVKRSLKLNWNRFQTSFVSYRGRP